MKNHFFIFLFFFSSAVAQKSSLDSVLIGTWKGTSICQIKSSPCHDEIAVYHVSKGGKPNVYLMLMNKIVDGKEEEMGTLEYNFDSTKNILTHRDEKREVTWQFNITDKKMDGALVYKKQLYRIIKLSKAE